MKKLVIVILNWNGKSFLEQFLPTLTAHTPQWAEIVVADNASTDNSVEFVHENYPQITLICNNQNYGFAEGYNAALKKIEAEYYCLLNSDVEVTPFWVEPIIEFLDKHSKIAVAQPKLLAYHQKDYFEYAGAAGGFIDKYGYPFCKGRIFNTLEKDKGQYDTPSEIFWATGACMFVRSKIYHQLGGLDGDFFAHMEEIDFCWRIKNAGFAAYCIPQSVVNHIGGGTLPKNNPKKTFLNFRNNLMLLYKNLPKNRIFPVLLLRWFLDGIATVKFLFEGNFKDAWAVCRAYKAFYFSLKKIKAKRGKISEKPLSGMYPGSIVFDYYLQKRTLFSQLRRFKT